MTKTTMSYEIGDNIIVEIVVDEHNMIVKINNVRLIFLMDEVYTNVIVVLNDITIIEYL